MPAEKILPPLSSTVSTVFEKFIQRVKGEKILNDAAAAALQKSLAGQSFGHEALRLAIFAPSELKNDQDREDRDHRISRNSASRS